MNIRFGLHLDGQCGWHDHDSLGEVTVGSSGMLGILEAQLGLIAESVPQSQRVVQYLDCLKKCNHADRFYYRSLEADELGTAATLLSWRDQWHLFGWNGEIESSPALRLSDMAAVESVARGKVGLSEGERLAMILQVIKYRTPAIDCVVLTHPLSTFPKRWRQVLENLPIEFNRLEVAARSGSFLNKLQDRLRRSQAGESFTKEDRLIFQEDGSVVVVRAETKLLAASWLANQIDQGIDDAVIVTSDSASLLDDMSVAAGQARQGLGESSAYRPALQLLPMALALLWVPLDFSVLISFLSHPISPVRSYARRKLAGKLSSSPGIGGSEWESVLADIDEHFGEEAAIVRQQIGVWIDHPRFEQESGVPIVYIMVRAQELANYFSVRLGDTDDARRASWNAGLSQATAFMRSLEQLQESDASIIRPRQLQKLLAQATSRGTANPNLVAEVGAIAVVSDPSAVVESFEHVIWWQPIMPVIPKSYPWSVTECRVLDEAGVELPMLGEVLDNLAADWLKPILAARKQLVIILPPKDAEVHPAWQMMSALVRELPEHSLDQVISGECVLTDKVIEVPHTPLPAAKRWWNLPKNTPIPIRGYDSFSSLELFIFNPYQWLLRYPAGLKASNILSVSDGFLLDGQLAHSIVEQFFALPKPLEMSEAKVRIWFDQTFPQVIKSEGAVLLMHGRRSDYEGLRYRLLRALTTLISQLKTAGIISVESELEMNGHYPGGEILGYADLVLRNDLGNVAIVDMKWGGVKKYAEKLTKNSHLQLGIYAELMHQKTKKWPEVAYYVLAEAKLFTQNAHYFPNGVVVNKKVEESTPHLWERFKKSYAWRSAQLKQRKFEVALELIEVTEESIHPEDGLTVEVLKPEYNDFLNLAGWRQS
jgi:hypothetical protein